MFGFFERRKNQGVFRVYNEKAQPISMEILSGAMFHAYRMASEHPSNPLYLEEHKRLENARRKPTKKNVLLALTNSYVAGIDQTDYLRENKTIWERPLDLNRIISTTDGRCYDRWADSPDGVIILTHFLVTNFLEEANKSTLSSLSTSVQRDMVYGQNTLNILAPMYRNILLSQEALN